MSYNYLIYVAALGTFVVIAATSYGEAKRQAAKVRQ